ncbi:MAG: capsular polysaccharide biosynthesis protein [Saccharofermentans sp.]|nr:capsular polysaccharide biosynthesis protein [Saccharofermentans sp.]
MIIDFHSHVLPGIDDGSKDLDMSREMLQATKEQGIAIQVATPHFYAHKMKADSFLEKREIAYNSILPEAEKLGIDLRLGAEVAFSRTMSEWDNIRDFTIKGTDLILIEMPFKQWSSKERDELIRVRDLGLKPILAHVERFIPYQKDKDTLDDILDLDFIYQFNCEDLLSFMRRGKVLKLIESLDNVILGSDYHNTTTRAQNLMEGRAMIEKKLGGEALQSIDEYASSLLI